MKAFSERIPPQSLESEQSVLGAMLIEPDHTITRVRALLNADDFYAEKHAMIFKTICWLADRRRPVDLLTLQEALKRPVADKKRKTAEPDEETFLDMIGGTAYLTQLMKTTPTTANVEEYAKIVASKAELRRLIMAGYKIADSAYEAAERAEDLHEAVLTTKASAQVIIRDLAVERTGDGLELVKGIGDFARQSIANQGKPNPNRLEFGLEMFDQFAWLRQEVLAVHAPSGDGKSTLVRRMLRNLAAQGKRVCYFSLEMGKSQVLQCFISAEARISLKRIRNMDRDHLTTDEAKKFIEAADYLDTLPIHIDFTPRQKWQEIRNKVLAAAMKYGDIAAFAIDYAAITGDKPEAKQRHEQMLVDLHYDAAALAKETNSFAIMVDQAPKEIHKRPDPTPTDEDFVYAQGIPRACDHSVGLVMPGRCKESGIGKSRIIPTFPTPGSYDPLPYSDSRLQNVMMCAYTKGRFAGDGYLMPLYVQGPSGYVGNLARKPWELKEGEAPREKLAPATVQTKLVVGSDAGPEEDW